jgi:hypothetical protein
MWWARFHNAAWGSMTPPLRTGIKPDSLCIAAMRWLAADCNSHAVTRALIALKNSFGLRDYPAAYSKDLKGC